MAVPTSRAELIEYCLRRLGKPRIEINVDYEQLDDRVDDALKYYWDYHFDGTDKIYYKYQVTNTDKTNKYITIPENIIGVVNIFPIGSNLSTNNLFNIRYQIALNDLYDLTATTLVPYYLAMQHIQFLEQMLVGMQPIRYNRHKNRLYIDMDWTKVAAGEFLVAECYEVVDPDTYTNVWGDRWLQRYCTALFKRQWGEHLSLFSDVTLPGGNKFNGDKIYNDAVAEIDKLEHEMIMDYSMPITDMIG